VRPGREIWVQAIKTPIRDEDGKVSGILDIFWDITESRMAAQKLKEQAELLDITLDAIFVRDMRHDITYWNKGAEKIFGWSAAEAIGRNADELLGTHAPDSMHAYTIVLEKGEWSGEFQRKSRDGRQLMIRARWTVVRDPRGEPRGILAVNTDVTEQRLFQKQLFRAQRLESVGTLAGGIAHDLNNILSPILMGVEALSLESDESSRRILGIMKTAAQRGAAIVRQVLSFARGIEGERAEVQLKHIISEINELIREVFPKAITIDFQVPKGLLPVRGDPTQLHQVLMNLCVNARDAMPEGGILTLSAENVKLDQAYSRMHVEARPIRYVVLKVEDNGTGMAPEILDKIFDPFFTTKGAGKGTGLGLSTSHSIVKSHGGFINAYSEVGKGSIFKVYIPAIDQAEEVDRAENVQEGIPMGEGQLILVVDDEVALGEITQQILESYGYHVLLARDGTEAVVLYAQRREDIRAVFTDMMMPYMDGAATIRALRKIDPTVKIISTSGLATSGQAKEAAGLGVDAFLAKPYTAEALLLTLRDVLGPSPLKPDEEDAGR
jgi:two-component system cell cycle sensor histidine kinase/response regulator CckA